jgi:hypothetical protein
MMRGLGTGCLLHPPTSNLPLYAYTRLVPDKISLGKRISWFKKSSNDGFRIKTTKLIVEWRLWEMIQILYFL